MTGAASAKHLRSQCPERGKSNIPHPNAQVSTCQVQQRSGSRSVHPPVSSGNPTQSVKTVDVEVQVGADSTAVECNAVESITDASIERDEYAKLHYLDVKVTDDGRSNIKVLWGLQDSGAEISVACSTSWCSRWSLLTTHWPCGIIGSPAIADLVKLNVALSDSQCNDNDDEYMSVLCAVSAQVNDDLVLSYNVVTVCSTNRHKQSLVTTAISHTDDDSGNDVNITVDMKNDQI